MYHTGSFPKDWNFREKRVGVIGSGSTGVQVITALGKPGMVKQLTSFQRSPQYSVPSGDGPVSEEERQKFNEGYKDGESNIRRTTPKHKRSKYIRIPPGCRLTLSLEPRSRYDMESGIQLPRRLWLRREHDPNLQRFGGRAATSIPRELGQGKWLPLHVRHILYVSKACKASSSPGLHVSTILEPFANLAPFAFKVTLRTTGTLTRQLATSSRAKSRKLSKTKRPHASSCLTSCTQEGRFVMEVTIMSSTILMWK